MGQGIVGDNMGIDLPQTELPQQDLDEEKRLAKFSKTKEFQRLKDYAENRIEFYQTFLPDGRPIIAAENVEKAGEMFMISNAVIGEFKQLLAAYENANEVVSGRKSK